jgi:threonyl-tRNA synthetase
VQTVILTVSDKHLDYAKKVAEKINEVRFEIDDRNESINKKIRDAELQKVPYIIVVGDREEKEGQISVRNRGSKEIKSQEIKDFLSSFK